jgi:hypothetical protein
MNSRVEPPEYHRARGYRIYGRNGGRYLDFYQDGGHAILGHRHPGVTLEMKNLLSRGQIVPYPTRVQRQTIKAVENFIPGAVEVRLYHTEERALSAAGMHVNSPLSASEVGDPAYPGRCSGHISFWRPFLEAGEIDSPILFPVFPISSPPAPSVLVFREKPAEAVFPSDNCSPLGLAALKKSIFELIRYYGRCNLAAWADFDVFSIWSRKGPYLTLTIEEEKFPGLFTAMLENGILLSPKYPGPSIIPGEYSPGEFAHLQRFAHGNG